MRRTRMATRALLLAGILATGHFYGSVTTFQAIGTKAPRCHAAPWE